MGTVTDFIFLGSKITMDGGCSHEIKRCLLLGRKAMTNLDSTLKSRDITLSTKVRLVKAIVFPVVMCGCEKTESESFPCGSAGEESACNLGDLGWEDPLEKGKATFSSVLAWRIPWTEEPGRLQSMGSQESDMT